MRCAGVDDNNVQYYQR